MFFKFFFIYLLYYYIAATKNLPLQKPAFYKLFKVKRVYPSWQCSTPYQRQVYSSLPENKFKKHRIFFNVSDMRRISFLVISNIMAVAY